MRKGRWQRFRRLSRDEKKTLVQAWCLLPLVDVCLRAASFESAKKALGVVVGKEPSVPDLDVEPERLSRLVEIASRQHLWPIRCLPRAMVLEGLLRRSGVDCALQIGARREARGVAAHAWVEIEGRPIGEAENVDERFPPLSRTGA
ncbi:MAG: lasso peptide biosynthesis B2 protein [Acidobacteriota bacterium]|nr:lasso peptide biosynthesis B2 protein [Acidobacteriota bacterium]